MVKLPILFESKQIPLFASRVFLYFLFVLISNCPELLTRSFSHFPQPSANHNSNRWCWKGGGESGACLLGDYDINRTYIIFALFFDIINMDPKFTLTEMPWTCKPWKQGQIQVLWLSLTTMSISSVCMSLLDVNFRSFLFSVHIIGNDGSSLQQITFTDCEYAIP